ncbi:unnamed protein product [Umbelopsis sp. WA50703]
METDSLKKQKIQQIALAEKHQREEATFAPEDLSSLAQNSDEEFNRIKRSKLDSKEIDLETAPINPMESAHGASDLDYQAIKAEETVSHDADSSTGMSGTEQAGEPGLHALYNANFDENYNEESDEDWDEEGSGSGDYASSDDDESHEGFFMGVNHKYNELEGNSGDEEENAETWPRCSEEDAEKLQNEARELGMIKFIEKYVIEERTPLPQLLDVFGCQLPARISLLADDLQLLNLLKAVMTRFLRKRKRLEHMNSLQDVVETIRNAKRIMVLTGAGVSVSCGIPDFRSETGIYARLDEFELDDPQQMFDIHYFRENPQIFYSFAREIYPSNFQPSPSHMFVKLLEDKDVLLRNYTQNIDTLEHKAKITRVINCHGSFATATCVTCGYKCAGSDIEADIFAQRIPECPKCAPLNETQKQNNNDNDSDDDSYAPKFRESIIKPDITFFGEKLPDDFDKGLAIDSSKVDLLIVMGSSLKVSPVSEIMTQIPHSVPQILINRTPITHLTFDVQLLGWDLRHEKLPGGSSLSKENLELAAEDGDSKIYTTLGDGYYVFPGAVLNERFAENLRCDQRGSRDETGNNDDDALSGDNVGIALGANVMHNASEEVTTAKEEGPTN